MNYLKEHSPVFAFNIWDINSAQAVMDAAAKAKKDIVLQTSASLYSGLKKVQLREFITSYKKELGIEVWLHLDHCRNLEMIKNAIDYGWDSVMIDASEKSIYKNIEETNKVTEFAHAANVAVEAEIGQVKGIEEDIKSISGNVATKEDIKTFIENTNVDMLAVAFGNAHGIYHGEPELQYELVEYTTQCTKTPFVVHGGSGLSDEALKTLLFISGVKKLNISTDVKLAYRKGILDAQQKGFLDVEGFQAVNVEGCIHDQIEKTVLSKLALL